jgi:hypothetical protein
MAEHNWEESRRLLEGLGFRALKHDKTEVSAATTSWGVHWDEEFIARDLLQNFYDANRERLAEVTVEAKDGLLTVSAPAPFELDRLFYFHSEKGEGDVGQYGEGFKAAVACLLRQEGVLFAQSSGSHVLRISVEPTGFRPLVYDYFSHESDREGTAMMVRGASPQFARQMREGMSHFFHGGNPLVGEELLRHHSFAVHRSTTSDGYVFYRGLRRAMMPGLPLVLVLNGVKKEVEKLVGQDRDRNAFGEKILDAFYNVWAKEFFASRYERQRIAVEAARAYWEKGHPLLARIASKFRYNERWSEAQSLELFGEKFFAVTSPRSLSMNDRIEVERLETEWGRAGRHHVPEYFRRFGVPHAETTLAERKVRAAKEAKDSELRRPSPAENAQLEFLATVVRGLAPHIMSAFDRATTVYIVARTEVLLGELRRNRGYRVREVFLSEAFFEEDFAGGLAIFLHEHAHIFGGDGSRGFTDELTDLLATVLRCRDILVTPAERWSDLRGQLLRERQVVPEKRTPGEELRALGEEELRALLLGLPPTILEATLRQRRERKQSGDGRP